MSDRKVPTTVREFLPRSIGGAEAVLYSAWLSEIYEKETEDKQDYSEDWEERARCWRADQIQQGRFFWTEWRTYGRGW